MTKLVAMNKDINSFFKPAKLLDKRMLQVLRGMQVRLLMLLIRFLNKAKK
ncbi:hypothetical protein ACTHQ8_14960 [Lysinibacillus odysseyi]|nr:hypothetical protein [Lysinibacillus odysseyi]